MLECIAITCPYCGETITLGIDCSAGSQHYVEDCQVCCRPMEVTLRIDEAGMPADVEVHRDDE